MDDKRNTGQGTKTTSQSATTGPLNQTRGPGRRRQGTICAP